jgi:hypothetical protein
MAGMLTIGPTILPITAALMIACAARQARQTFLTT